MSKSSKEVRQQSKLILEELEERRLFSGGIEGLIDSSDNEANAIYRDLDSQAPKTSGETAAAELIEDGRQGLLVPPKDPLSLASAICRLAEDPDLARRLAEAGRRRVEEEFSVDAMVRGNLAVYRELEC